MVATALAVAGCRSEPGPDAHPVEGPGLQWTSPSGLVDLRWVTTRWARNGDRLRAELGFEGSGIASESAPPVQWTVRDVIGPIARGEAPIADGLVRIEAELPAPPPRVLAIELEVGPEPARWSVVHRLGAEALVIHLADGTARVPHAVVPHWASAPVVDGRLDEAAWSEAPKLELSDSMGRPGGIPAQRATTLQLAYDDANLYVGFTARDPDVTERFAARDDPVYDHEAVELFLMPHAAGPETGPYVELQASPTGVIFDASFTGPRRGMDPSWDGGQTVASVVEGTLDDQKADSAWTSEWKIPFESLRWVRNSPNPGDVWRMNAFRIDRSRGLPDLYVAWSPPRVGDFHRVERFGFLEFGARTSTTSS